MTDENYTVRIHREDEMYWAEVLELPGCFASGETHEELLEALAEAIGMYLSSDSVEVKVDWASEPEIVEERKVAVGC